VCLSVCVSIGAQHNADCLAIWRVLRCSCSFRCILSVHPSPSAFLAFASAVIPLNDAERIRQKRLLVKAPCYRYRNGRTGSGDEKDYAMTKLKTRLPSADGTSSSGPALPPRWFRLDSIVAGIVERATNSDDEGATAHHGLNHHHHHQVRRAGRSGVTFAAPTARLGEDRPKRAGTRALASPPAAAVTRATGSLACRARKCKTMGPMKVHSKEKYGPMKVGSNTLPH
jgi:hypothetical protein